jgi:hypothetical protein
MNVQVATVMGREVVCPHNLLPMAVRAHRTGSVCRHSAQIAYAVPARVMACVKRVARRKKAMERMARAAPLRMIRIRITNVLLDPVPALGHANPTMVTYAVRLRPVCRGIASTATVVPPRVRKSVNGPAIRAHARTFPPTRMTVSPRARVKAQH